MKGLVRDSKNEMKLMYCSGANLVLLVKEGGTLLIKITGMNGNNKKEKI